LKNSKARFAEVLGVWKLAFLSGKLCYSNGPAPMEEAIFPPELSDENI